MSIFTRQELEFLASLKNDWRRLYQNELARLLNGDDNPSTSDNRRGKLLEEFPMLRVSVLIAALTLMETVAIVVPAAAAQSLSNATAFSFERCEAACSKNYRRHCEKWCQRRRALSG